MWRSRVIAATTALKFTIARSKSSGQNPKPLVLPQVQFSKPDLMVSRFVQNSRFLSHDSKNPSVDENVDGEFDGVVQIFDGGMESFDGGSDDADQVFDESLEFDLPEVGGEDLFRDESSGFGLRNEGLGDKNFESGTNGRVGFGNFSFNLNGNETSGISSSNGDSGSKTIQSVADGDGNGNKVNVGDWNFNLRDFESSRFGLMNDGVDSKNAESVVEVEGQEFDSELFESVLAHIRRSSGGNGGNVGDGSLLSSLDNISLKRGDADGSIDIDGVKRKAH